MSFQVARSHNGNKYCNTLSLNFKLFVPDCISRINSSQYNLHEVFDKFQHFKRAWWIFNFSTMFLFSYNFFPGIICPRFCEASQMPASDWREAGFSDKRWLRLILIRRGEKVNARDKFILDIKDSYDGHNHSNDEIDTDTDTHSGLTQLSLIILHTVGKNGDNLPSLDSTLHH